MTRRRWRCVYLALGSNLEGPVAQLRAGVAALRALDGLQIFHVSSLVRSAPADGSDQPDYVNAVLAGMTTLAADALLSSCRGIELRQGRDPAAARWSARTLDIDLIALGDDVHSTEALTVPHPRLAERAFVLQPLAQIAPWLRLPGFGRVRDLNAALDAPTLERLRESAA